MMSPGTSVTVLWGVWGAGWLLAARSAAPAVSRDSRPWGAVHLILLAAGLLVVIPRAPSGFLGHALAPAGPGGRWLGAGLTALGLGFAAWARAHLGRFWSSAVALKEGHVLVRTGPYRMTRHPIYTGLIAAAAGTALVRGTAGAALGAALLALGLVLKLRREERLLLRHFGPAYETYRREVPCLVPHLW